MIASLGEDAKADYYNVRMFSCSQNKLFHRMDSNKLLAHDGFSSYSFILETPVGKVWRQSVAMVNVINSTRSSHFGIKMVVFHRFLLKKKT